MTFDWSPEEEDTVQVEWRQKGAPGRRTRMDKGWEGLRSAVHLENKAARVAAGESGRERESRLLATRPDSRGLRMVTLGGTPFSAGLRALEGRSVQALDRS